MLLERAVLDSPIGPLQLVARGDALVGLEFHERRERTGALHDRLSRYIGAYEMRDVRDPAGAATRLARYFAGDPRALDGQNVELLGTGFERAVWDQLLRIPTGVTISYAE